MYAISSEQVLHLRGGFEPILEGKFINGLGLRLYGAIASHMRS